MPKKYLFECPKCGSFLKEWRCGVCRSWCLPAGTINPVPDLVAIGKSQKNRPPTVEADEG